MPEYKAANNISYTRLASTDLYNSSVNYTIYSSLFHQNGSIKEKEKRQLNKHVHYNVICNVIIRKTCH